ncbi:MAG: hypothetical protein U0904_12385 [Candidatus Nanopelagicales bacterium]|nr:hypothetical protein [Candidatus Nanopelagicales bacterium]
MLLLPHVYDAGALIALEASDRRMWSAYRKETAEGRRVVVPTAVIAQAWRRGARQPLLARVAATVETPALGLATAKAAGELLAASGTSDVVDAVVVVTAMAVGAIVWTSDPDDLHALASAVNRPLVCRPV